MVERKNNKTWDDIRKERKEGEGHKQRGTKRKNGQRLKKEIMKLKKRKKTERKGDGEKRK